MAQSSQEKLWREGVKLALALSGWLVGPLLIALITGQWLDNLYQTKPWIFLGCALVAFIITSFGIVYETKKFLGQIEKTTPEFKTTQERKIK